MVEIDAGDDDIEGVAGDRELLVLLAMGEMMQDPTEARFSVVETLESLGREDILDEAAALVEHELDEERDPGEEALEDPDPDEIDDPIEGDEEGDDGE